MTIAFYAPMKPPDHAVPSGDRHMARALIRALESLGHEVTLASRLRCHFTAPDVARLDALRREGALEAARILAALRAAENRPSLWMTYHPSYKSPDFLGPVVAAALGIPYITVEAAYAGKRSLGDWAPWQRALEPALRAAALHFCITPRDRDGLASLLGPDAPLKMLPPFLTDMPDGTRAVGAARAGPVRLIAVAMMRPGAKLASYTFLAAALGALLHLDWHLTIVGDGAARAQTMALFDAIPGARIGWAGARGAEEVAALLAGADIFVWPGIGEAYGIVYLEAQAAGLPVIALDTGGVAECVRGGVGGVLVKEMAPAAYAAALARLIADPGRRARMGAAARHFVRTERSLAAAARSLGEGLASLTRETAA